MDNALTLAAIIGFAMPPLIAALNRRNWSSEVKGIVAFTVCLVAGVGTAWWNDDLNQKDIRGTILIVFGAAIVTYHQFWRPSGISDTIEKKTG